MTVEDLKVAIDAKTAGYKQKIKEVMNLTKESTDKIEKQTAKAKSGYGQSASAIKEVIKQKKLAAGIYVHSNDYKELQKNIQKTENEIEKLQSKMKRMRDSDSVYIETAEYKELTKCISDAKKKLTSLLDRQDRMEATGTRKNSKTWKNLQYDIEEARNILNAYKIDMDNLKEEGQTVEVGQPYKEARKDVANLRASLREYQTQASSMQANGTDVTLNPRMAQGTGNSSSSSKLQAMKAVLDSVKKSIQSASGAFSSLIHKFQSGIGHIHTTIARIKSLGSNLRELAKRLIIAIPLVGRLAKRMMESKSASSGLSGSIFKLGNMFKLLVIRTAMRTVFSKLQDGLKNLVQYSDDANKNVSELVTVLTQLGNTIVAAFEPILRVVTPILKQFIEWLIQGIDAVTQFFAALTGSSAYTVAKKVNIDYAQSLQDATDSANDATKATKGYQNELMGFDEMNRLSDQSDNSSSDTGTNNELLPSDVFGTAGIDNKIQDLVNKFKEAWKTADFTEIGALLGRKLNDALKSISWTAIRNTAKKIAKSIATFLNGFIRKTDWTLVGWTIAEGLNTAFGFADSFAQNFDWSALGTAIGNGINGALENINWNLIFQTIRDIVGGITTTLNTTIQTTNWSLVGRTIGNIINSVIEVGYTFVTTFDWKMFGKAIADSLNGVIQAIDWSKAGKTLSDSMIGILDLIIAILDNFDWTALGNAIGDFLSNIDWSGIFTRVISIIKDVIFGLIESLSQSTTGKIVLVVATIVLAFNGFTGIIGIVSSVVEIILSFTSVLSTLMAFAAPIGVTVSAGIAIIVAAVWDLWNTSEEFRSFISSLFSDVRAKIEESVGKIKEAISPLVDKIKELGDKFYAFYNESGLKEIVRIFLEIAASIVSSGLCGLIDGVTMAIEGLAQMIGGAIDIISGIIDVIWGVISGDWDKVKEGFSQIGTGIIDGLVGGLLTGLKAIWETVKSGFISLIENVKEIFGVHSPSTVFAKIGSFLIQGFLKGIKDNIDSVLDWFAKLPETIKEKIGNLREFGKSLMDNFVEGFKSIHIPTPHINFETATAHIGALKFSYPKFSGVEWYARGGFPENGEMFIANEAGPEMVGKIGNKNAVANSNQIVEAVSQGVANAVASVLGFRGQENIEVYVTIEGDSSQIFKVVRKEAKKFEKTTGNPAF